MARLRKFTAYRRLERPYTRVSKFKKKSFIKANPNTNIVRYEMGDPNRKFDYAMDLISKDDLQIRHNAIESARQSSNRLLEHKIGQGAYFYKIRIYPHHILRENPLASGAGADRFSTGMQHSFGKPIGKAAQVRKGQVIASISVDKAHVKIGKLALQRIAHKLPGSSMIQMQKNL
jgi:large subunit ribosomal protein L10e